MLHNENLTAERPTFVTHLECAYTGEHYPADTVHNLSRAGKPCRLARASPALTTLAVRVIRSIAGHSNGNPT